MTPSKRAHLLLLLTAFLWGMSFVAQSAGMEHLGPFTFNALRYGLGALILLPFVIKRRPRLDRNFLKVSLIIGLLLSVSTSLQQFALQTATAGKAGFITSLYIVFVPLISRFFGKKISSSNWFAVIFACFGLFLMTSGDSGSFQMADLLLLLGAIGYSFHIIFIAKYSGDVDAFALSSAQFLIAAIFSLIAALFFESASLPLLHSALPSILYSGIFSCGVAFTLQIVAQRDSHPTVASLIMSLEAVFAAIGGAVILRQMMNARELAGSFIMLMSVFFMQYLESRAKAPVLSENDALSSCEDESETGI